MRAVKPSASAAMRPGASCVAAAIGMLAVLPWSMPALRGQQPSNTSGAAASPEHACWTAVAYRVRLELDPTERHLRGRAEIQARARSGCRKVAVDLDPLLQVDRVAVAELAVAHHRDGERVVVELPREVQEGEAFSLLVEYSGKPREAVRPPWSGGIYWSRTPDGRPWIVSDCRLEGADVWMPCNDRNGSRAESVLCELVVPKGLVAVAVGEPAGTREVDADRVAFAFAVRGPVATGDLGFCVGPFERLEQPYRRPDGTTQQVAWYVCQAQAAAARRCMPQLADQLAVYEALVGAQPHTGRPAALVHVPAEVSGANGLPAYGGMFLDEQFDPLLNRAVAWQLVQQAVECLDWRDAWLREALGAYLPALYREARYGAQAYRRDLVRWRPKNLEPLTPSEPKDARAMYLGPSRGGDLAAKGFWVLHTLRWQIGDEAFFAALRAVLRVDADGPRVHSTAEFLARCSEAARRDLAADLAVYLQRAEPPTLEAVREGARLRLRWVDPEGLPVALAVPVVVGGSEVRVEMPLGRGEVEVGDREYRVDPEQRVLMRRGDGVR